LQSLNNKILNISLSQIVHPPLSTTIQPKKTEGKNNRGSLHLVQQTREKKYFFSLHSVTNPQYHITKTYPQQQNHTITPFSISSLLNYLQTVEKESKKKKKE